MNALRGLGPRRASLRARIALTTAILVTSVVALGGGLMIWALHNELLERAADDAALRAEEVASQAAAGRLPSRLPVVGDEVAVQVVVGSHVVSATSNVSSHEPWQASGQGGGPGDATMVQELPIDETGPWLVAEREFTGPQGTGSVLAAVSVEDLEETFVVATRVGVLALAVRGSAEGCGPAVA